ncbi:MAG: AsmA family protein [Caulobacteraceae bacterium]
MQDTPKSPPRRRTHPAAFGAAAGLALFLLIALFQWNWLRGPLAWAISGQLHRPVRIAGNLKVHPWSATPWASVEGLTIGDAGWAGGGTMIAAPRLTVQTTWRSVLGGAPVLPLVWAREPRVKLARAADGRVNWNFGGGKAAKAPRLPAVGRLVISGGRLSFTDAGRRVSFAARVSGDERLGAAGPNLTTLAGSLVASGVPWSPRPLARLPRLVVKVRLLAAMRGHLELPLVEADGPVIFALRDGRGRENWRASDRPQPPLKAPPIGRLILAGGAVRYEDVPRRLSFAGTLSSSETVGAVGRGTFQLQGRGRWNGAPFTAAITGGPLVNVDASRPYPFTARIAAGATKVAASGALAHPFDLNRVAGRLKVSGPDFAGLKALTGVALPSTPPYDLSAGFARVGVRYAFRGIAGRVGDSDLAGDLTADSRAGRPFVVATLASRRLKLADLAAVIGGAPRHVAGHTLSPAQKALAAKLAAEHRILPDTRLDVKSIRGTDARLTYRAASVQAGTAKIRGRALKLVLDHGLLVVDPLTLALSRGDLSGSVSLDARGATPREAMEMRLTNARLENLIGRGTANPPLEGGLYGRAKLSGRGDSVRAAAATADGNVSLVVPHGEIRKAFAELLGIDAANGLFLLLTKNQGETPIRCAVADFRARAGVLTADRIVLDTGVVLAQGSGRIDLRDETLNLALKGKPKKFRLLRIGAPITVKGSLLSPKFGVDAGKAAGQVIVGGVLGVLVAPLAAILPFVNAGLAKNADCVALTGGR